MPPARVSLGLSFLIYAPVHIMVVARVFSLCPASIMRALSRLSHLGQTNGPNMRKTCIAINFGTFGGPTAFQGPPTPMGGARGVGVPQNNFSTFSPKKTRPKPVRANLCDCCSSKWAVANSSSGAGCSVSVSLWSTSSFSTTMIQCCFSAQLLFTEFALDKLCVRARCAKSADKHFTYCEVPYNMLMQIWGGESLQGAHVFIPPSSAVAAVLVLTSSFLSARWVKKKTLEKRIVDMSGQSVIFLYTHRLTNFWPQL